MNVLPTVVNIGSIVNAEIYHHVIQQLSTGEKYGKPLPQHTLMVASYPGLQSRGGRPGIHCLRMCLISLENRISWYSSVKR